MRKRRKNIKCKWHITSPKYLKIRLKYDEKREILFNRNYIVSNHVLDLKEMIAIGKCKVVKCVSRNMGSSNQRKQEEERRIEKTEKMKKFFDNVLIKIEQKEWIISLEVIFFFFFLKKNGEIKKIKFYKRIG